MTSDQYPKYYKAVEVDPGHFDSLDILILFHPSSIITMRDNCTWGRLYLT